MSIWHTASGDTASLSSYADYRELLRSSAGLQSIYAVRYNTHVVQGHARERVRVKFVSPGYLRSIGAPMAAGRSFAGPDDGEAVVILSHRLAASWHGKAEGAVGSAVAIDGEPHRVVGVLGAGIDFYYPTDALKPLDSALEASASEARLLVGGRLAPGIQHRAAQAAVRRSVPGATLLTANEAYAFAHVGALAPLVLALLALVPLSSRLAAGVAAGGIPTLSTTGLSGPTSLERKPLGALAALVVLAVGVSVAPSVGGIALGTVTHPFDFTVGVDTVLIAALVGTTLAVVVSGLGRVASRLSVRYPRGLRSNAELVMAVVGAGFATGVLLPVLEGAAAVLAVLPVAMVAAPPWTADLDSGPARYVPLRMLLGARRARVVADGASPVLISLVWAAVVGAFALVVASSIGIGGRVEGPLDCPGDREHPPGRRRGTADPGTCSPHPR